MPVAYPTPTTLAQGVNTFLNEGVSTAIVPGPVTKTGSPGVAYAKVCTNTTSLFEALDISLSANVIEPGWSADAKAQLVASLNISSTSVTIAVYVNNVTTQYSVASPTFQAGIPRTDPETFFSHYGDSFVSQLTLGSEYMALYTFYTTTTTEQETLVTQINAMGLNWNASLQATLNSLVSSSTTTSVIVQSMGGVGPVAYPEPGDIVSFARRFRTLPISSPLVLNYATSGYETVPGAPWDSTSPVVRNRTNFLGVPGLVPGVADQIAELQLLGNQFSLLKKLYKTYGYVDSTIVAPQAMLNADFGTAAAYVTGLGGNPTVLVVPVPRFGSLDKPAPLPMPSFSLHEVVSPINSGDTAATTPFGNDIAGDWVAEMTLPTQVVLESDPEGCSGLSITYRDAAGTERSASGGSGTAGTPLVLQPGEVIASVSGTSGEWAFNALTITTSFGTTISAKGGISTAQHFSWSSNPDAAFLGFSGLTGSALLGPIPRNVEQLTIHYVSFAPAIWRSLPDAAAVSRRDGAKQAA